MLGENIDYYFKNIGAMVIFLNDFLNGDTDCVFGFSRQECQQMKAGGVQRGSDSLISSLSLPFFLGISTILTVFRSKTLDFLTLSAARRQ